MPVIGKLGALLVVVGLALAPTQVSAQGVEVESLETGGHCGDVDIVFHNVSGGCELGVSSVFEVALTAHLSPTFEVSASVCHFNFDLHVNSDGEGYGTDQSLDGVNCTTPACAEVGSAGPWPVHIREDGPSSSEQKIVRLHFCVVNATFGPIHCELDLDIVHVLGAHEFEAGDRQCVNMSGYPRFEVSGHWWLTMDDIEVHHADDV